MTTLIQDLLVKVGGADNVYRILGHEPWVQRRLVMVAAPPGNDYDRAILTYHEWPPPEGVAVLRKMVAITSGLEPVRGPALILHHHTAVLVPVVGDVTVYFHTPTRLLWEPHLAPEEAGLFSASELQDWRAREIAAVATARSLVANSQRTAHRVQGFYGRTARVVEPPVSLHLDRMSPPLDLAIAPGTFIAVCTRLVRAKRIELAIEAAASLHLPLVIVGEGRDRQRLESLATSGTIFAGYRPPGELRWILRNARLFVSAAEEDFGIAVAEALCEGTPCVVPDASGVVSLLAAGMGWTYDAAFGAPALIASIESALGEPSRLSPQQVRRTRKRLARETFRRRIAAAIA